MKEESVMEIFGTSVQMGEKTHKHIIVGELANGSPIYLPMMVLRGTKPGPVLWMCGAVHGNELNGCFAMREAYLETNPEDVKGSLIFTPVLNVIGFFEMKKHGFLDLLNMDQQFPGKIDGLMSQQIAFKVFREIKKNATALISFHTPGPDNDSPTYTVSKIDPKADSEVVEKSFQMALSFGTKINIRVDLGTAKEEMPGVTAGTLDSICLENGIPAIMAEMGKGGRWEVPSVVIATRGIYNVMRYLKMSEGDPEVPDEQIVIPRRKYLRSTKGGFAEVLIRPGDVVRKGKICARVINFWEVLEELSPKEDMYTITVRSNPVVASAERIASMGFDWYTVK